MANEKRPKLASRCYWKHGQYYFVSRENKWIPLGRTEAEAYESLAELHTPSRNMHAVFDRYVREQLPKKGRATQKEYSRMLTALRLTFGHMEPRSIRPSHVAEFHDAMGASAPVASNRHKSVLADVFSFALRVGAVDANPCVGVRRHPEKPRDRYVSDVELEEVRQHASQWLQIYIDCARLIGQRQANLISLMLGDVSADCIRFPAMKGGRAVEMEWSPELRGVYERALAHRATFKVVPLNLLVNGRGQPLTAYGLRSAWRRLWDQYRVKVTEARVAYFTMHDLRAKAGSDSGDPRMLGHRNPAVFHSVYDRKPTRVKPSK